MEVEENVPLLKSKRSAAVVSCGSNVLRKFGTEAKGVLGLQGNVSEDGNVGPEYEIIMRHNA